MKKNAVAIIFTSNIEELTPLINLLKINYDVSVCSYESPDSWADLDFNSSNNNLFVLDKFPEDNEVVWIVSKLVEDGVFSTVPVLFTCFEAMYVFENSGYSAFAYDVLPYPFDYDIAAKRIQNIDEIRQLKAQLSNLTQIHTRRILNQANKLKEQNVKMQTMNFDLVELLVAAIESRDLESGQHIKRIRLFTKALTEAVMELCPEYGITREQADHIYYASSVHDIGKIAIPDAIMLKPGRLTEDEFEIMKTHTTRGAELLGMLDDISDNNLYFKYCQDICYSHHERWDGNGYPRGLKGDEIPISAQIVSIADCYDALTSHRTYKAALSHEDAVDLILTGACGAFSPVLLKCFESVLSEFAKIESEFKSSAVDNPVETQPAKITTEEVTKKEDVKINNCENDVLDSYDIIFEANLKKDLFSIVRGDWLRFFPYVPKNFLEFVNQCNKMCHPADATRFNSKVNVEAFQELVNLGRRKTRIEFRAIKDGIEYLTVGFVVFKVDEDKKLCGINGAFSIYNDDEILTDIKRGFGVTDGLTGLSLPKQFEHDVDSYLKTNPNSKNLMIFIDIDDMSMCNNIFGYEYGNALIKEFAGKLRGIKSKDKLICKAASDKFCLFVKDVTNQPEMVVFIEKLHNLLKKPYHTATENGFFTATMGISRYPNDGATYKDLVFAAEYASKSAKTTGKNAYAFYNNGMKFLATYSVNYDDSNRFVSKTEYEPKFAPIVDAVTGELVCYDYIPFAMFKDSISVTSEVYYELNKNASTRKNLSMISIKSLLLTAISMKKSGQKVPPLSVYTMILPDDMPGVIQELSNFVKENDCSNLDVCIILPQDFLENVSLRKLRTFSEFIKEMGFSLGLYLIGTRYIHNNCYVSDIFDRYILTSEFIAKTLATGATEKNISYAADTLNNLKTFVKEITIPTKLEDFEIEMLLKAGAKPFSSAGKAVFGTNAVLEDFAIRNKKLSKNVKISKAKIAEVDKDMLYFDLVKSPCAILTADIKNDVIYMSPNSNDVFGFDIIDYFSKQEKVEVLSFVHPDDAKVVYNALVNSRINLSLTNTTVRLSTLSDRKHYRNYSANFLCVIDEGGTPIRYQCFIHRISE